MALERPLYKPCIAAHSPQRLEMIAAFKIANMLVNNSLPNEIKKSAVPSSMQQHCDRLCYFELDKIIIGSSEERELFKNQFKRMKTWWEKSPWFGPVGSPLRNLVQERVSYLLDHLDYYSHCPLFTFTCQLCYTKQAGIFSQNAGQVIVKVEKRNCDKYASFLESLGLFKIERLLNSFMIFGNPNPLVVVVKNSPFLKCLSLRYNSCDYVMSNVGMFCSKLERFIIEDFFGKLCVSEKYLYKTFFGGRSKHEVKTCNIEASDISFPNLCQVDVGKGRIATEFLYYMCYHYPRLRSISCNSWSHAAMDLIKTVAAFKENFDYKMEDICLTTNDVLILSENKLFKFFPNIKHITLTIDYLPIQKDLKRFEERMTTILSRISRLTIHLPYNTKVNAKLNTILVPVFLKIGSNIRVLQFFIFDRVQAQLIYTIIKSCLNLELLTIRCCSPCLMDTSGYINVKLSQLSHLKSFSIILEDGEEIMNLTSFLSSVDDILVRAPSISCLELVLPGEARDWIVNAVAKGYFNHVSKFLLCLHSSFDVIDVDFYVVLIEGMTSLKQLILMEVSPTVLAHLKRVFAAAQLRIIPSKKKLIVAHHGIHSKYIL